MYPLAEIEFYLFVSGQPFKILAIPDLIKRRLRGIMSIIETGFDFSGHSPSEFWNWLA